MGAGKPNAAQSTLQMTETMNADWGGAIAPAVGAGKPNAAQSTQKNKKVTAANSKSKTLLKSALSKRKRKHETCLNTGRSVRFNFNHLENTSKMGQNSNKIYKRHRSYDPLQRPVTLNNTGSNMMEVLKSVLKHKKGLVKFSIKILDVRNCSPTQLG